MCKAAMSEEETMGKAQIEEESTNPGADKSHEHASSLAIAGVTEDTRKLSAEQNNSEQDSDGSPAPNTHDNGADRNGQEKKDVGVIGQFTSPKYIMLNIDRHYQMHRLAAIYFASRHFWWLFLPPMSITMISGVLAFLIKSDLPLSEFTRSLFAVSVGCASIVNVFLQNMNNELNFDHRAKSHNAVARGMKLLLDEMTFMDVNGTVSTKVNEIEGKMDTILKQNDSNMPGEILIAYDLASSRLAVRLFPPVRFDVDNRDHYNKIDWMVIMGIVHNEIYTSFITAKGWPMFLPNSETVVNKAIANVREVLENEMDENELGEGKVFNVANDHSNLSFYKLLLKQQNSILQANLWSRQQDAPKTDIRRNSSQLNSLHSERGFGEANVDFDRGVEPGEVTPLL